MKPLPASDYDHPHARIPILTGSYIELSVLRSEMDEVIAVLRDSGHLLATIFQESLDALDEQKGQPR